MSLYHAFLLQVEGRTSGSNLSHLTRIGNGKYKDIVQECILKGFIEVRSKNSINEDLYFITDKGRKILENPKEELL